MPTLRTDVTITEHDLVAADGDVVQAVHGVEHAVEAEHLDDHDLIVPLEEFRRWTRARPADKVRVDWLACDAAGVCVGAASYEYRESPENRHLADVAVAVVPSARRAGIGSALLHRVAARAATDDRPLLHVYSRQDDAAAAAFAATVGGTVGMVEHRNVLRLADIPPGLLDAWVARAAERASAYSLVSWTGPCPDEWAGRYCAAYDVMNTAPREDLDMEDFHMTVEQLRAREAANAESGTNVGRILCAVHDPTGEIVGMNQLFIRTDWPAVVEQGNTGVAPQHRDRGLGRLLKAENLRRLLNDVPAARHVETWNAGSNEPMLAINHQLGFRLLETWSAWQISTASVLAAT